MFLSGMRRQAKIYIAETRGYTHPQLDVSSEALLAHWASIVADNQAFTLTGTLAESDFHVKLLRDDISS
jgi:hypothetical protein